ncbi:MAG: class I SAM-dependent methyltransferase [Ardenticatenaceae bacterium]|nr:class I SAM-dependent methyltransferase [Ardenticatenaceae bacterium]
MKNENNAPKNRFTNRATYYARYRPTYPTAVLTHLQTHCNLTPDSIIADIGSGTGLLAQLFLEHGNTVYGVEPNRTMREAGEAYLVHYGRFCSINASAESTTLPDNSIDFITAGQAAHWFDLMPTKAEFERILRADGYIAFAWNEPNDTGSSFMREHREIVSKYQLPHPFAQGHPIGPDLILEGEAVVHKFDNFKWMDYEALEGGALSSSSAPLAGHPNHELFLTELRRLFDKYAENGRVQFRFKTTLRYAKRPFLSTIS